MVDLDRSSIHYDDRSRADDSRPRLILDEEPGVLFDAESQQYTRIAASPHHATGLRTEGIIGTEFEYVAVAFFDLQAGLKLAVRADLVSRSRWCSFHQRRTKNSAVLIGAATLLYHCWCPIANKAYQNYASFKAQGKVGRSIVGMLQLVLRDEGGYKHLCTKDDALSTFLVDYMGVSRNALPNDKWQALDNESIGHAKEAEAFWYVWHFAERTRPLCRLTVSALYVLGFLCLGWIFAQSIAWVWAA